MKKTISALVASFVLVFALTASHFAADLTKSFTLTRDSKINGQAVKNGDYSVKYSDDKDGELILLKGKKEVVKSAYKLVQLSVAPSDDKVTYTVDDDGSFHVKRLEFKGSKAAISFE
jgi:hypothetical protein